MLGLATNGMMGVFGVALSRRFGPANFGRCFSVFSVVNLPFTVAGPFVFGQVFASTGSYAPAFIGQIAALGVASAIALALHVITRKASAH